MSAASLQPLSVATLLLPCILSLAGCTGSAPATPGRPRKPLWYTNNVPVKPYESQLHSQTLPWYTRGVSLRELEPSQQLGGTEGRAPLAAFSGRTSGMPGWSHWHTRELLTAAQQEGRDVEEVRPWAGSWPWVGRTMGAMSGRGSMGKTSTNWKRTAVSPVPHEGALPEGTAPAQRKRSARGIPPLPSRGAPAQAGSLNDMSLHPTRHALPVLAGAASAAPAEGRSLQASAGHWGGGRGRQLRDDGDGDGDGADTASYVNHVTLPRGKKRPPQLEEPPKQQQLTGPGGRFTIKAKAASISKAAANSVKKKKKKQARAKVKKKTKKPVPVKKKSALTFWPGIGMQAYPVVYHGGPVMAAPLTVHFIYYGNWTGEWGHSVLRGFVDSLGSDRADRQKGAPTVHQWWAATSVPCYQNLTGVIQHVTGTIQAGKHVVVSAPENATLRDGFNEAPDDIWTIVLQQITSGALPEDPNAVYVVITSSGVRVGPTSGGGFCSDYCGWHREAVAPVSGNALRFLFVGDPSEQCNTACGINLGLGSTPNGFFAIDSVISTFAHELAESATNPDGGSGWWALSADGSYGVENGDLCIGAYTDSKNKALRYGKNNGGVFAYNLRGVNQLRFLVQSNVDIRKQGCVLM